MLRRFIFFACYAMACTMVLDQGLRTAEPAAQAMNLRRTTTVDVVRRTKDAVVNISATKIVAKRVSPFGADPFWQQFDVGDVVRVPSDSLGSGFIIHPDGYVVTNHHVIDRARAIKVELADGRKLDADLISSDSEADLAILKIASGKPLPIIELGDSSDLMIGEPVIAVGNPMGYSHSVSTGIVSAIHRDLKDRRDKVVLGDLVQTDAAINPGNSGGPLLNAYGQIIGINTAIRGDAQNIGFAIPVNRLRDLIPELMSPLHATKLDIPLQFIERRRLTEPARIDCQVLTTGTAGQVVASINGQRPGNIVDAYAALLRLKAEHASVAVRFADGSEKKIAIKPAPVPTAVVEVKRRLGMTVEQVTPMLAEKYQLKTEDGVLITEVERQGAAGTAGLKPSDIIIQVRRYRVNKIQDLTTLLERLGEHAKVRVGIIRGENMGYTTLEY